jgi:hypothetical protein
MNNPKFYPAWRYHPTEPLRVVTSYEDDVALGEGWYDHPLKASAARLQLEEAAAHDEPKPPDEPKPKRSHHRRHPVSSVGVTRGASLDRKLSVDDG